MAHLPALAAELGPEVSARWFGAADQTERGLLRRLAGPVLEVGCGPARLVEALIGDGVLAMGIDIAPAAVTAAFRRGVPVLNRCVFDPLPGEGDWASALLLDGSIGIGGDPCRLLARVRAIVRPGATVLVEVEAAGAGLARTYVSDRFPWACVDADHVTPIAEEAGLSTSALESLGGRWFAWLVRP